MAPNQPKTPARTVRIPDDVWDRLREHAAEQGMTASDIVREAIDDWLTANDTD